MSAMVLEKQFLLNISLEKFTKTISKQFVVQCSTVSKIIHHKNLPQGQRLHQPCWSETNLKKSAEAAVLLPTTGDCSSSTDR